MKRETKPSTVASYAAGVLAAALFGGAQSAHAEAKSVCYDFSNLPANQTYQVGDVVQAEQAEIKLTQHVRNGNPVDPANSHAYVVNNVIAGGTAPNLRMYLINTRVTPQGPIRRMTMKFGQTQGSDTYNIAVNGEKREFTDGLASINGDLVGKAVVVVDVDPNVTNATQGTLAVYALNDRPKIDSFAIGGQQLFINDVCMTK